MTLISPPSDSGTFLTCRSRRSSMQKANIAQKRKRIVVCYPNQASSLSPNVGPTATRLVVKRAIHWDNHLFEFGFSPFCSVISLRGKSPPLLIGCGPVQSDKSSSIEITLISFVITKECAHNRVKYLRLMYLRSCFIFGYHLLCVENKRSFLETLVP